jgi:putative ABC transport system permease protein
MSAPPLLEVPPAPAGRAEGAGGGMPARRAVIRWALRLLRREWRQQLLILGLVTVAVGATVIGSTVATNTASPIAATLGSAQNAVSPSGTPAHISAQIAGIEQRVGRTDVVENATEQVPGSRDTFDLRAQDPHGAYGGPMLSLVNGAYPAAADQIAVTGGLAADLHLRVGGSWAIAGRTWTVTGIVENPQNLLDAFALVEPGQVANPDDVTVLFDAPASVADGIARTLDLRVTDAATLADTNVINPRTISIVAAVLGMLLIALVGVGGFTVLAQRRLRAIGMLAAQGATARHIRLVVRANGAATGVVGAVAGLVLGFAAWLAYRPHAEQSAHHVMGAFNLPWTVVGISMALAVVATYAAASRPAKAIARVPITAALAGRPPAPKKTRHLVVPIGVVLLVLAFLLLGTAGATSGNGNGSNQSNQMLELVAGVLLLGAAVILLAPACLALLASAGRRTPIAVRLALRDLARYRARSGPALAAISLSTLIAVIVCVAASARLSNPLDYTGPNLSSNQLIVYAPPQNVAGTVKNGPAGGAGPNQTPATPVTFAQAQQVAQQVAADLGGSTVTLETAGACVISEADTGRSWSGAIYVATPQLLAAYGIASSQINANADLLSTRPGLSSAAHLELAGGDACGEGGPDTTTTCPPGTCVANPPIQNLSELPSGTSAPNTVITQHAIDTLGLQSTVSTVGWLVTTPGGLTAAQSAKAQQLAAAATGMSVETRNSIPSLAQIVDTATLFGMLLALGILGMSVGLVRSEAARDLRTLSATGAAPRTRRSITAATAGALALTGAVIGTGGGYLAMIGFLRSNQLDGLSSLSSIPVANLLLILLGTPLAAAVLGWLLAGREPAGVARQPLE